MARVSNSTILRVFRALATYGGQRPKAGLFGFKYSTAIAALRGPAQRAAEALDALLPEHVEIEQVPNPKKQGEMMDQWVKAPNGRGFVIKDKPAYDAAVKEIADAEVEIEPWPPVKFTQVDIERAQVEIANQDYENLAELLVAPLLN